MKRKVLHKISFISNGSIYQIYARKITQSDIYGFIEIADLTFGEASSLVVDPSAEKLKSEFNGVNRTLIPTHLVLRIDVVEKEGNAKIIEANGENINNVSQFPNTNFSIKNFPYKPEKPS